MLFFSVKSFETLAQGVQFLAVEADAKVALEYLFISGVVEKCHIHTVALYSESAVFTPPAYNAHTHYLSVGQR